MIIHRSAFDMDAAALDACAAEPIHIPGSIQPRGVLIALDTTCETVLIASANAPEYFARPMTGILGQRASDVLGKDRWEQIRSLLGSVRDRIVVPIPQDPASAGHAPHAILAHRFDERVIVEFVE
jgi:light-regulated signal transduction histidine kinase (bacteriophytochrome)